MFALFSCTTCVHQNLFKSFSVVGVVELTLGGNAALEDVVRLQWKTSDDPGELHVDMYMVYLYCCSSDSSSQERLNTCMYCTLYCTGLVTQLYISAYVHVQICIA